MRSKGKITTWKDDKGFGFIEPFDGGAQVFIHIKALDRRNRRPAVGDVVTYTNGKDDRGRPRAERAILAANGVRHKAKFGEGADSVVIALLFLIGVCASALVTRIPFTVFIIYLVASLVTLIAYAIDKSAAQAGRWRIPEQTLHLLAVIGGWPGALVARQAGRSS